MDCILLAAGIGSRLQTNVPKQFYLMMGKPLFIHCLEILEEIEIIENVFVTCNKNYLKQYEKNIQNYSITKAILVKGGKTRQESVALALNYVNSERVIIHEAARPLVTANFIKSLLDYQDEAIVPVVPVNFTVAVGKDYMIDGLDRTTLKNIQLPQIFNTKLIKKAHKIALLEKFSATEDSILIHRMGRTVRFVPGMDVNIKITTVIDLLTAESILKNRE